MKTKYKHHILLQVDLLSAIAKYAPDNPFIAIFGCILAGSLDPIMFRYSE